MKVGVTIVGDKFKLYINDLPHLVINDRIIGYQSYIEENKWYKIEFYLKDKTILVEYENDEHWVQILKELDKVL